MGVTFSFLISAPMVNEVALVLLFGLVGWQVAAVYFFFGLAVAIVSGWVIGRLHLEGWLQDWVRGIHSGASAPAAFEGDRLTMVDRYRLGLVALHDIVGRVWKWILAGIAVGALIHGYPFRNELIPIHPLPQRCKRVGNRLGSTLFRRIDPDRLLDRVGGWGDLAQIS